MKFQQGCLSENETESIDRSCYQGPLVVMNIIVSTVPAHRLLLARPLTSILGNRKHYSVDLKLPPNDYVNTNGHCKRHSGNSIGNRVNSKFKRRNWSTTSRMPPKKVKWFVSISRSFDWAGRAGLGRHWRDCKAYYARCRSGSRQIKVPREGETDHNKKVERGLTNRGLRPSPRWMLSPCGTCSYFADWNQERY